MIRSYAATNDDNGGTSLGPIDGDEYNAYDPSLELQAADDEELDEPAPWRCRDPRYFRPPRGRRYVTRPLPPDQDVYAQRRRQRPRMGLRFAVG